MRRNLPVSHREHPLDDGTLIVSQTDEKGGITAARPDSRIRRAA